MAGKPEKSKEHKDHDEHPQKPDQNQGQDNRKEPEIVNKHSNFPEPGNFDEGAKGKFDDRGFKKEEEPKDKKRIKEKFPADKNGTSGGVIGVPPVDIGTDLPGLTPVLDNIEKSKGCLTSFLALFILAALVLVL